MKTKHAFSPLANRPGSIITASLKVIHYLCENAREDEVDQYEKLMGEDYDPDVAATLFFEAGPWRTAVVGKNGYPACAGGYRMIVPGVYQSWMVGTPIGWEQDWREIHRATRWLMTALQTSGARRLQTSALASRTEACAWYEKLGMEYEGTAKGYGTGGEDVAMYGLSFGGGNGRE